MFNENLITVPYVYTSSSNGNYASGIVVNNSSTNVPIFNVTQFYFYAPESKLNQPCNTL